MRLLENLIYLEINLFNCFILIPENFADLNSWVIYRINFLEFCFIIILNLPNNQIFYSFNIYCY